MNTNKLKLVLCTLCGLLFLPNLASAYEVTDTNAVRLNDDTVLFSITYKFGFLNRESLYPIIANQGNSESPEMLDYEVRGGGEAFEAFAPAVVLSDDEDVEVRDGMYYLPEGKNAEFTLIGLLALDESDPREVLQLVINRLPYTTLNDGEMAHSEVLPEELPDYRSPQITLLGDLTITMDPQDVQFITSE